MDPQPQQARATLFGLPREPVVVASRFTLLLALAVSVLFGIKLARESVQRASWQNHLKQLALAALCYRDSQKCFPPAAILDENGQPMHSWRVLVEPYIQCDPFCGHYKLDEPWNGLHNKVLLRE
jgi:hypothetical protein